MNTHEIQFGGSTRLADFRPVIGQRRKACGLELPYFSPLGKALSITGASQVEVDAAVRLARQAFEQWRDQSPQARRTAMLRFADAIDAAANELGALDCFDMGKPITAACEEAHVAAHMVRWYAEAIDKVGGFVAPSHPEGLAYCTQVPYGVVAAMVSWNYPVINAALKIAPALAAGNAIVLKPSEHAPLSALRLGDLALASGLPEGLLCVLHGGPDVGAQLCQHADVGMVSFTGSSAVSARVAAAAAPTLKPLILECGGKNPILVCDDIEDIAGVVRDTIGEAFANTGQLCVARSKLIVPRVQLDTYLQALDAALATITTGAPDDPATLYGPLAHPQHARSVHEHIGRAADGGACLVRDGRAARPDSIACGASLLQAPQIDSLLMTHEFFGPVLGVYAYDSLDEGIAAANSGGYGLAATVWTQDLRRARLLTQRIHTGQLVVRAQPDCDANQVKLVLPAEPAGRSGYGIEFGVRALQSYSRSFSVQYLGVADEAAF